MSSNGAKQDMPYQTVHKSHHATVFHHINARSLNRASADTRVHHAHPAHHQAYDQPVQNTKDRATRHRGRADAQTPAQGIDDPKDNTHHPVHHPAQGW